MRRKHWLAIAYFALSIVAPLGLLYPTLIYGDLAGMGGYDGFASPALMRNAGTWATPEPSWVYIVFSIANCIWWLSLINLPLAVGIALKLFRARRINRIQVADTKKA